MRPNASRHASRAWSGLAENVYATWIGWRRAQGLSAWGDSELYAAGFDLTYDYDIWPIFEAAVRGEVPVARYLEMIRFQSCIYPAAHVKMRCVENHDQLRIQRLAPDAVRARAWTAFAAFQPGAFLIYAGQESGSDHAPTLFERDPIDWAGHPLQGFLARLGALKKEPALMVGGFQILAAEPAVQAAWLAPDDSLYGVFSVAGAIGVRPGPAARRGLPRPAHGLDGGSAWRHHASASGRVDPAGARDALDRADDLRALGPADPDHLTCACRVDTQSHGSQRGRITNTPQPGWRRPQRR